MKITFEGTIEELMKFFGGIEEEKKETEKLLWYLGKGAFALWKY